MFDCGFCHGEIHLPPLAEFIYIVGVARDLEFDGPEFCAVIIEALSRAAVLVLLVLGVIGTL